MKRIVLLAVGVTVAATAGAQEKWHYDSTRVEKLSEVVVSGVRVQKNAPYAVANLEKRQLNNFSKTGRELPFLFSQTPGVVAWSENGLGTGTTYMRIRGAGDSRINVTLDGVPLNSPEDQCVFWANMNSYGSLLGSVQIQRGVGTSTNGDGAFGGTVAMQSAIPSQTPALELTGSYGTYNTFNVGGNFSTGLLWNHLIFDGAYHETNTDGFIHGTSGRSGSYYGGLTFLVSDNLAVAYKNIGNFEKTGQAWNGVTAGTDDLSIMDGTYGAKTGIKTYKDMWEHGLGKYNSLYEAMIIGDDGSYSTERYTLQNTSNGQGENSGGTTYWEKATDNFWQNHNLLRLSATMSDHWSTSMTLHYTHGYGYYREFRPQNKLKKFGFSNFTDSEGNTVKKTDFIRKKGLKQDVYGFVWNLNYKTESWDVIAGMSAQQFFGNHFGYLTYVANKELSDRILANGDYQYYDSDAEKSDANIFLKAAYSINDHWHVFGDVQYRNVNYLTNGINDKFLEDNGRYFNQSLHIDKKYDFLNPKAGLTWTADGHRAYGSVAMSHREPERNNYTDNGSYPAPKAEQLIDYEVGYTYGNQLWRAGVNFYYMDYKDQFVQTGQVSDIGEKLTTNVKDSYRMGVEMQAGIDPTRWLTIEANAALSQNKIKDFDEEVEDWDNGSQTIHYDNSTLAFSPSAILNGFVNFHWKGVAAVWHTNFVSRQYLDNTQCRDRSLPAYTVSNLNVSYTLKTLSFCKETIVGLNFSNVFNARYAANAWVYSAIYESGGHTNDNRYYQIGFIPMSGFTMMGNLTLRF